MKLSKSTKDDKKSNIKIYSWLDKDKQHNKTWKENIKINLSKGRVLLLLVLTILFNIIMTIVNTKQSELIGFMYSLLVVFVVFAIVLLIISKITRKVMLLIFLVYLFNYDLQNSANYCADPKEPSWSYFLTDSPEFNGIPKTLKIMYNIGMNPCDIPQGYITKELYIKDKH